MAKRKRSRVARRERLFGDGRVPGRCLVIHNEPPTRLYKFTQKRHAESMCKEGQVRIGTLYEYRDFERYNGLTVDVGEGNYAYSEEVAYGHGNQLSAHVKTGFARVFGVNAEDADVGCSVFTEFGTEPNCYIYCASKSDSWSAVDSDYDTCVEIVDTHRFICAMRRMVEKALSVNDVSFLAGSVSYRSREQLTLSLGDQRIQMSGPFMPAFTKPLDYAAANEFRIAFVSKTPPGATIVLSDPAIGSSCRIHSYRGA